MECLKRKRTQLRREFTILADNFEKCVAEGGSASDIFGFLSDTASKMMQVETELQDIWCEAENFEETTFQADQDKSFSYKLRWHNIKSKFSNNMPRAESACSLLSAQSASQKYKKNRLTLPKLELPKFDGEVRSWLLFWGQFKKIDGDADIDDSDKYQYLLQSMTPNSSARQLVESYPPSAENYSKALEALKTRFARDEVLIETYVRGLLKLMQRKEEKQNLPALYDNLQSHLQALDTLGVTKDKYAAMLFPMIESAIPEDVLRAWHRSQPDTGDLSKLMNFLKLEVESEERIRLSRGELAVSTSADPKPPTACFTTETKQGTSNKPGGNVCIWCDKENHSAIECYKAAKMTLKDRVETIKSKKACLICSSESRPSTSTQARAYAAVAAAPPAAPSRRAASQGKIVSLPSKKDKAAKLGPRKDLCDEDGFKRVERKKRKKPTCRNHLGSAPTGQNLRPEVKSTQLYVSRLHWSTKVEDVVNYVQKKSTFNLRVERLVSRHKVNFNSFVVRVPTHHLEIFMKEDFWPQGVVFRRFRGRLPADVTRHTSPTIRVT